MSFSKCAAATDVISQLSDTPSAEGVTADQLKGKFDQAGAEIKSYLNDYLLPTLESSRGAANIGAVSVSGFAQFNDVQTALTNIIQYLLNLGNSATIADGAITTAKLANLAVTSGKIANGAVTEAQLGTGAVSAEKLASGAVSAQYTALLNKDAWEGSAAPYRQTVNNISGLLASDEPIADVSLSGIWEEDSAALQAYAGVYLIETGANSVTVYATEKPTAHFTIRLLCVRK